MAAKPKLVKVGRIQSQPVEPSTTTTEEVIVDPVDGSTKRVVRTIRRTVTMEPVTVERTVRRTVTQVPVETQPEPVRVAVQKEPPARAPAQERQPRAADKAVPRRSAQKKTRPATLPVAKEAEPTTKKNTVTVQLKPAPQAASAQRPVAANPPHQPKQQVVKSPSLDIPFADEVPGDLDVPYDMTPASQNTPKLIRASSVKKRQKQYSVTEAGDEFAPALKSPQPKVSARDDGRHEAWAWSAPMEVKVKSRPHSYHGGTYRPWSTSSTNSSGYTPDEPDGREVFNFEYHMGQPAGYGTDMPELIMPASLNEDYGAPRYAPEQPVTRTQSLMLKSSRTPGITITNAEPKMSSLVNLSDHGAPGGSSKKYRQNLQTGASLNRAASLQLRAYKNKASMVRYASLTDDWADERPQRGGSLRKRRPLWTTKQLSFKACDRCRETSHVRTEAKLSFDEFHDHFFHTQWPSQTIMICELKFVPSDKIVKFRVTSCNRFSANEGDDPGTHAEVFFSEFLRDKVVPNLLGGDVEKLAINVWMNNSPCNQKNNLCAERITEAFESVQKCVKKSTMSIAFCHLSHLQETDPDHVRTANIQGLIALMANPRVTVRQFTGYDWMELLMVRTDNAEKWLKLQNGDLRQLIEDRYEKDAANRANLRELIYDYQSVMAEDIHHVKRAMARINVI